MKICYPLWGLLFFLLSQSLLANQHPDYVTVVKKFFAEYSTSDKKNGRIVIEKRPEGWFVGYYDHTNSYISGDVYWDAVTNEYKNLQDWDKEPDDFTTRSNNEQKFLAEHTVRLYRICPYYGYPGWDYDVIKDYGELIKLPDSTLYAVGRAYSSYASNLLHDNGGLASEEHRFQLPFTPNCLTPEQLEKYRFYRHTAIEKFYAVEKRNPGFETIVGTITVKAANEHVTAYLDLLTYQNEKEALKELKDGIYSPFMVSVAKNYLISCLPNAILFTYGDNDTYPLLYVQAKLGFRQDVYVANLSLLNTARYITLLRNTKKGDLPFPLSLTTEEVRDEKNLVTLIDDGGKGYEGELSEVFKYWRSERGTKSFGSASYKIIPVKKLKYTVRGNEVHWELPSRYLYLSNLVVLDIINTNKSNRPIYFASTVADEVFLGLDAYLTLEGWVYRLTSQKSSDNNIAVNGLVMYGYMMNDYEFLGYNDTTAGSHKMRFYFTTRFTFIRMAKQLIKDGENEKAIKALDKCMEVMPANDIELDNLSYYFIETYYDAKGYKTGNNIAKDVVKEINERTKAHSELNKNDKFTLQGIERLARNHDQQEILDIVSPLLNN